MSGNGAAGLVHTTRSCAVYNQDLSAFIACNASSTCKEFACGIATVVHSTDDLHYSRGDSGSHASSARCAGFRGVSAEQDGRFKDKERKLMASMRFPREFDTKVNLVAVNWTVMKPWIATRVTELLGIEDDVLIEYIYAQLEGKQVII